MRTNGAIEQKLKQVGAQHVPVVIVVLAAVVAAHHETSDTAMRQQRLVDREIAEIGLHRRALIGVQWLAGLKRVQCRRRITGIVGERVGRQGRWQVVAHRSRLRSARGIAPDNLAVSG